MNNWFNSRAGVVTLSAVAFILLVARTFLDFQFVFPEFAPTTGAAAPAIGFYTVIFGGWLWALLAGMQGSRAGLIAALVFPLLFGLGGGIATLVSFCPSPCPTAGGLMEIANWSNLVTGGLADVAVGSHLWQGRAREVSS